MSRDVFYFQYVVIAQSNAFEFVQQKKKQNVRSLKSIDRLQSSYRIKKTIYNKEIFLDMFIEIDFFSPCLSPHFQSSIYQM